MEVEVQSESETTGVVEQNHTGGVGTGVVGTKHTDVVEQEQSVEQNHTGGVDTGGVGTVVVEQEHTVYTGGVGTVVDEQEHTDVVEQKQSVEDNAEQMDCYEYPDDNNDYDDCASTSCTGSQSSEEGDGFSVDETTGVSIEEVISYVSDNAAETSEEFTQNGKNSSKRPTDCASEVPA